MLIGIEGAGASGPRPQRPVAAPGTVHTSVPVNGLTCLMVPSAIRIR